jgi:hypothetical protein
VVPSRRQVSEIEEMRAAAKRTVKRTSAVTLPTERNARLGWQKSIAK